MADGGEGHRSSFYDSFSDVSGDVDELLSQAAGDAEESFCNPCKTNDNCIAAEGYCIVCKEHLCKTCLGVHREQNITRAHVILDNEQIPAGQGSTDTQNLCIEVCQTHHPEIMRFYCRFHDIPGCIDCMAVNHTSCQINRVPDISRGFQKTREFKDIDRKLQQLYQQLEELVGKLNNNFKNLNITYNNVLLKIASVRAEINMHLDEIETKVKDEAAQMMKSDEIALKSLQEENSTMKTDIEAMLRALHQSNVNMNSLFVITKQAKNRLVTLEKECNNIAKSHKKHYTFLISNEIENILSAKPFLGHILRANVHVSARRNNAIKVACKVDTESDCKIVDLALLSEDRLVVTDMKNMNVKLIDISNNTVIATFTTTSQPRAITTLSKHEIAVTVPSECKILILNVASTLTLQREITVDAGSCGIAYKDGKFAVSYVYPGRVEILDVRGNVLHTIQPKQGKKKIF